MSSRRGATGARSPQAFQEEDEELDLPPLDGALDDGERPPAGDEDDEVLDEQGASEGDDRAAHDLDPGVAIDDADDAPIEGGEPARDAIDTGALADDVAIFDEEGRSTDERGPSHEEDDDSPFDASMSGEDGAGTGDDPSSFVDEGALPPLDADGDDGEGLVFPEITAERPSSIAAEKQGWRAVSGVGAQVPSWLVAASPAHVVAAGPTVVIARDGGRVSRAEGPEIDVVALATAEEAIFAVARKGTLFASVDGGDTWATGSVPWTAVRGTLAIAATPGRLWVCEGGALWSVRWSRRSRPEPPIQIRKEGVRAMTAAGSTLVILAEKSAPAIEGAPEPAEEAPRSLVVERLRGDDEAPDPQPVPDLVRDAIADAPVTLAATMDGRALSVLSGGALHLSRDGGASFRRCVLAGVHPLAMTFAGNDDRAPLLILAVLEDRSRSGEHVILEVGEGDASRLVEAPGAAPIAGPAALVWDAMREILWVASSSGLQAFERAARH